MSNTVEQDLNNLANLEAKIDFLRLKERTDLDELIPAEVQVEIETVKEEYKIETAAVQKKITELKEQIKTGVLFLGGTVKTEFKQAIWNKGRISWDSKGLQGFEVAHPEISVFKKVGNPTVSFRDVKV
jgi:hypothetical protein